jgi:hypothetical protein
VETKTPSRPRNQGFLGFWPIFNLVLNSSQIVEMKISYYSKNTATNAPINGAKEYFLLN